MKKSPVSNLEKSWMVKASDTIMGPYSLDELSLMLRSKQLGLLDETKRPSTRWAFIRDVPELQAAVNELANETDTIEKTHTAAHTQVSVTRKLDDEVTPVPIRPISPPIKTKVTAEPSPAHFNSGKIKIEPVKSYGLSSGAQPINFKKWSLHAFVGVCAIVALIAFFQRQAWDSKQKKIWSQVQQLFVAKLYDRAFSTYKEFQLEPHPQAMAIMRLGLLHLNPGQDLVKARRFFEMSIQLDPKNREIVVPNLNGLALVSLYEGQPENALEYLSRASALEKNNSITKINTIAVRMSGSKWNEAMREAQELVALEPRKSYLIQAVIVAVSGLFKNEIPNLLSALNVSSDQSMYLKPEMKLMSLHLAVTQKSTPDIIIALDSFFRDLPAFAMSFSEDPTLDQRWRDWNYLYQFCSDLEHTPDLAADFAAVKVVCLTQVKRWTEAEKVVAESLVRFPSHPRILLSQLHLLSSMGRWPEVRGLSKLTPLASEEASTWYFARTCFEEKQDACVDSYLNAVIQKASVKTYYFSLKAQQKCRQKIYDGCRYLLSQGLSQDPISTELLSLRHDLEESL